MIVYIKHLFIKCSISLKSDFSSNIKANFVFFPQNTINRLKLIRKTADSSFEIISPHISHLDKIYIKIDKNKAFVINDI